MIMSGSTVADRSTPLLSVNARAMVYGTMSPTVKPALRPRGVLAFGPVIVPVYPGSGGVSGKGHGSVCETVSMRTQLITLDPPPSAMGTHSRVSPAATWTRHGLILISSLPDLPLDTDTPTST